MRTRLLRPAWLVMHVLVAVSLYAMVRLGDWQWSRGEATGSIRNYSYGLEWWAFAALVLVGWVKFCRDETRVDGDEPAGEDAPAPPAEAAPAAGPAEPEHDTEDDPELAAWNARFAALARRDAESSK